MMLENLDSLNLSMIHRALCCETYKAGETPPCMFYPAPPKPFFESRKGGGKKRDLTQKNRINQVRMHFMNYEKKTYKAFTLILIARG